MDLIPFDAKPSDLAFYDAQMRALDTVTSPGEAKHLYDVGDLLAHTAKRAKRGWDRQQRWAGFRLLAFHRLGEILGPLVIRHCPKKSLDGIEAFTLKAHGISYDLSSEAQKIAAYPRHMVEAFIAHATKYRVEITTRNFKRYAGDLLVATTFHPSAARKDEQPIRVCYADPPYLGCAHHYRDHPNAWEWNDPERHRRLIEQLGDEFPDGWALSCGGASHHVIRSMCPDTCRTGIWTKPFAGTRPNIDPTFAWEAVIWCGGHRRRDADGAIHDWVAANIPLARGMMGVKPREVCRWIFALLKLRPGDELVDLFPGSGAVTAAWQEWIDETPT